MHDKVLQALEGSVAKQDGGIQNQIANKLSMLKVLILFVPILYPDESTEDLCVSVFYRSVFHSFVIIFR